MAAISSGVTPASDASAAMVPSLTAPSFTTSATEAERDQCEMLSRRPSKACEVSSGRLRGAASGSSCFFEGGALAAAAGEGETLPPAS